MDGRNAVVAIPCDVINPDCEFVMSSIWISYEAAAVMAVQVIVGIELVELGSGAVIEGGSVDSVTVNFVAKLQLPTGVAALYARSQTR